MSSTNSTNSLAAAVQRELARQQIGTALEVPDEIKGDALASAVRRNLPAEMRSAFDAKPKRNSTEPTPHMPPAPKSQVAEVATLRCGGDAVFEAVFGRLPLGDIDEAERARVYADISQAMLSTKSRHSA